MEAINGIVRLILNGKAAADESIREAVGAMRSRGHRIEVRVTWEEGCARRFAKKAAQMGCRAVIAAGGDGTLNECVNGLLEGGLREGGSQQSACALGVLPFGTANDFAVGCGIPADALSALELALETKPTPIDIGRVNDRLFLNCATGGYGAQITAETSPEMKKLLGGFAYFVTGVASMTSLTPRRVSLAAPGLQWEGDCLGLVVANGRQSGGGMKIAPQGLLDDGLLDLLVIPDAPLADFLSLIGELTRLGVQDDFAQLIHKQVPWVEVKAPEGLHVNIDGEPLDGDTFRFEALKRVLPCFLPAGAPLVGPL